MQFPWDAARGVKLDPVDGVRSLQGCAVHEMRLTAGQTEPIEPPWGEKARGGASAASLFAEFARPPSRCFRTRHGSRRSARSRTTARRQEVGGYWEAIVIRLVNVRPLGDGGVPALEGVNEPEQRDKAGFVVDAADRGLERLAGLEDTLAEAHLLLCQVGVDLRGKRELSVADEVQAGRFDDLVLAPEVEIYDGRKVRLVLSDIQGQQRQVGHGEDRTDRVVIFDVAIDLPGDLRVMAVEAVEGELRSAEVISRRGRSRRRLLKPGLPGS